MQEASNAAHHPRPYPTIMRGMLKGRQGHVVVRLAGLRHRTPPLICLDLKTAIGSSSKTYREVGVLHSKAELFFTSTTTVAI